MLRSRRLAALFVQQALRDDECASNDVWWRRDDIALGFEILGALLQTRCESLGSASNILRLHARLLAGFDIKQQLLVAVGEPIDLHRQPRMHCFQGGVHRLKAARFYLLEMLRNHVSGGEGLGLAFHVRIQPVLLDDLFCQLAAILRQWIVIEIWRRPAGLSVALGI